MGITEISDRLPGIHKTVQGHGFVCSSEQQPSILVFRRPENSNRTELPLRRNASDTNPGQLYSIREGKQQLQHSGFSSWLCLSPSWGAIAPVTRAHTGSGLLSLLKKEPKATSATPAMISEQSPKNARRLAVSWQSVPNKARAESAHCFPAPSSGTVFMEW